MIAQSTVVLWKLRAVRVKKPDLGLAICAILDRSTTHGQISTTSIGLVKAEHILAVIVKMHSCC
eukprot:6172737-Pleurochrysis_carterae.AAC.2